MSRASENCSDWRTGGSVQRAGVGPRRKRIGRAFHCVKKNQGEAF